MRPDVQAVVLTLRSNPYAAVGVRAHASWYCVGFYAKAATERKVVRTAAYPIIRIVDPIIWLLDNLMGHGGHCELREQLSEDGPDCEHTPAGASHPVYGTL